MSQAEQQPLEFSPPMLVAIGVVALIGLASLFGSNRHDAPIVRVSDESIEFPQLGVKINPTDGWTLLSTASHRKARQLTFVNEASQVIMRFESWPPNQHTLESPPATEKPSASNPAGQPEAGQPDAGQPDAGQPGVVQSEAGQSGGEPLDVERTKTTHQEYAHVTIDWGKSRGSPTDQPGVFFGRLHAGNVYLKVTVIAHSKEPIGGDSVKRLCDSIEVLKSFHPT